MKEIFTIRTNLILLLFSFLFFLSSFTYAQDFGFGFDDSEEDASGVTFDFGGEVSLEFPFYFKDYKFEWEEIASGKINFNVNSQYIEAITSFNIDYYSIEELGKKETYKDSTYTPLIIDEAFLRVYAGQMNIEAGYRKLTWGRADSSGPLDVTNPVDFTDLRYITDLQARKIARPMLRLSYNAGSFSKLEGIFIPNFAPDRFAQDGRWVPLQYSSMPAIAGQGILTRTLEMYPEYASLIQAMYPQLTGGLDNFTINFPSTSSFENFQAGLRYTTTVSSIIDIGVQYYYGNLFRPNFTLSNADNFINDLMMGNMLSSPYFGNPLLISPQLKYTRYHQIGVDYAQVISSFNIRAEFAVNLTEDITGKDGRYQNPFLAWSLGFDRDLFWGINLNMQCNETIRLMNNKIGDNPLYDSEANTNVTNTRFTCRLSKSFFRDNLETNATCIYDLENTDFYIIPSVSYALHDFIFNVTAGFFAGNKTGELGQYHNNNFIRVGAVYKF